MPKIRLTFSAALLILIGVLMHGVVNAKTIEQAVGSVSVAIIALWLAVLVIGMALSFTKGLTTTYSEDDFDELE